MKLGAIKHHFKILLKFLQFSFMKHMAFRFEFFFGYLIDIGWLLFTLALFKVFYLNISEIAGWNYGEILVLLGTFWIYESLFYGFVVIHNLRRLPKWIWTGELDMFLTKPLNSQFFVSTRDIWFPIFLNLIPAIYFIFSGLSILGQKAEFLNIILFLISSFLGILIIYGFWFIVVTFAFFLDRADNLPYLPQAIIDRIGPYPIDIFKDRAKFVFIWFIPLAFIASFPARILLEQLSYVYLLYAFLLAVLFIYLSDKFFKYALKHYCSASS